MNFHKKIINTLIKYLDIAVRNKVEYSEKVIKRITDECHYFPSVNDINRIFQDRVNILKPIGGCNESL